MKIPASVEFNELSDVCASIHLLTKLLEKPTHAVFDWKWIILSTHSAVQGSLVSAISGTAGIGALSDKSAKEMLEWFDSTRTAPDTPYPGEWLADFSSLLKRAQDKNRTATSRTLSLSGTELQRVKKLHNLRCSFSHFVRMTWTIELDGISEIILTAVRVVEFLTLNNDSVRYRFEDGDAEVLQANIARIQTLLR